MDNVQKFSNFITTPLSQTEHVEMHFSTPSCIVCRYLIAVSNLSYIHGSFNEVVNSSAYVLLNDGMISEWTEKDLEVTLA
jgi:hypothetical protein